MSCSVSPSVELLESKVSCICRAWPSEKLTEKVKEYNLLFLFKSRLAKFTFGSVGSGECRQSVQT